MSAARRGSAARQGSRAAPNPAGAHRLAEHAAARLVRQTGVGAGDVVLDIGAGLGALTRPLARTGARVIAIERDERIGTKLRRQLAGFDNVTVVIGDALAVPLPHRPFRVVANLPFSITTPLLRRLVGSRLVAADVVVERRAGRRFVDAASGSGRRELVDWHRRFAFSLGPLLSRRLFQPAPPVDAVVLRLRRRLPPVRESRTQRCGREFR